jgi:glycine oxidase
MLAPDCEAEAAPPVVRDLGREGLALWRAAYPPLVNAGSLVVAAARDRSELVRFARLTERHQLLAEAEIGKLEPDLAGRFSEALFFADEAHMAAPDALAFLLVAARAAGADLRLGTAWQREGNGVVIDCRGLAARDELTNLRGVRGERLLIRSRDVKLSRPVRLLHPRHPLYVVPWGDGRYLVGATMIESDDEGPITVRSALELLGAAYALSPAFGEAEILETGAGVRPAFPDNVPRAVIRDRGRRVLVNGAFRHGFLLAPVLAAAVADFLATGATHHPLLVRD